MRIDALWQELELEAKAGTSAAWLTRLASPHPTQELLVALETEKNRRALLLPMPRVLIPPRRDWPECRGLEVFTIALSGQAQLGVRLLDEGSSDVFSALAEDVTSRVAEAADPRSAAGALLGRLFRWQKFLSAGTGGLAVERQRGLVGELHALRELLIPSLGASAALRGWRAPKAAHQDFQIAASALEVKTTTAKQPQMVRITSERQLDDVGTVALFLHVVVLDEREADEGTAPVGETLPDIVRDLRQRLLTAESAGETFEDRLLDAGYLEADASRYERRRFTLRGTHTYRLGRGFPRLVEGDLPNGLGDVSYALSLAACEPFRVTTEEMVATLESAINADTQSNQSKK